MPQSLTNLLYHIIYSTKNRRNYVLPLLVLGLAVADGLYLEAAMRGDRFMAWSEVDAVGEHLHNREVLQLLVEKGYDRYINYEAPNPALWSRPPAEVALEGVTQIRALIADALT